MRKLIGVFSLILFLSAPSFATRVSKTQPKKKAQARQMQPSPERIAEIQSALKSHGYEPGESWEETKEICRTIANEHQWQTDHAPDARVLILLRLAGPHADPAVAQMDGGRLDKDQRSEAARVSALDVNSQQTTRTEVASRSAHSERTATAHVRRVTLSKKKLSTHNKHHNLSHQS